MVGGNSNIFDIFIQQNLGEMMIQFDGQIFQKGWFNHHLVLSFRFFLGQNIKNKGRVVSNVVVYIYMYSLK